MPNWLSLNDRFLTFGLGKAATVAVIVAAGVRLQGICFPTFAVFIDLRQCFAAFIGKDLCFVGLNDRSFFVFNGLFTIIHLFFINIFVS